MDPGLGNLYTIHLVTFFNEIFRNDKHLFPRLQCFVKRKRLPYGEVATGALKNICLGI